MKLIRYEYPPVNRLSTLMEQFLSDLGPLGGVFEHPGRLGTAFSPAADLYEEGENYFVRMELPGVKKTDLRVELENAILTVSAEVKGKTPETVSSVSRSVSVPEGVDAEKVSARYEDGILTVTLPKHERHRPRAISIR